MKYYVEAYDSNNKLILVGGRERTFSLDLKKGEVKPFTRLSDAQDLAGYLAMRLALGKLKGAYLVVDGNGRVRGKWTEKGFEEGR